MVKHFLLEISLLVSSKVPWYLHFFPVFCMFFYAFFFRVQSSALYKKMLSMCALKIPILFLMVNLLLKAIFNNLLKARMVKHFLLEISLLVSSKHFFQLSVRSIFLIGVYAVLGDITHDALRY